MSLPFSIAAQGEWPRCLLHPELLCGDPGTTEDHELLARGWHLADCCSCPSCPLRIAISGARPRSDDGLEPIALEYRSDPGNPLAMMIGLVTVVLAVMTIWLVWTS